MLQEQLRLCRLTYNTLLEHSLNERKAGRGIPNHNTLTYLLPEMKNRTPELGQVFSQVLQNVAKRVRSGFENYWTRKRAGLKARLPRFQGADMYDSLMYPQSGFRLKDGVLCLSKIGEVRIIRHRPVEGKMKTLTVTRSASGKWFAVFSCEVEAPRSYRGLEANSRRAHRNLSRKRKGSRNREKVRSV